MARRQDTELLWTPLLLAVGQGSQEALNQLYKSSSRRLYAIVRRVQPDDAEAEDVLQEVYIKIWTRVCTYDPGKADASAWLHGIARHAALDSLRRAHARPRGRVLHGDDDNDPYGNLCCAALGPLDQLLQRQSAQAVRRSLTLLSADTREVVLLTYDHDLSQRETATRVGRPLGTVKSLMRRGLQALRPALEDHR